uniref:Hvo_1808 family surface protein n=1 Tax=Halorussus litoreus TaxID=1710536 RepID=UPI0018E4EB30
GAAAAAPPTPAATDSSDATAKLSDAQTGAPAANAQDEADATTVAECAATPSSDLADPESDATGWESGYWYNETLDVNQSDGLTDEERESVVARTMARVEAVRCIEFDESVPVSVISREQFRESDVAGGNVSEALRAFDNAKFESMFLVGEETDSIEVQRQNRGSGVLGFYSPQADRIVVVAENADELRLDEITLAHELVHAWQDQRFGLESDPLEVNLRDEVNARNGIVEGDASYVDRLYQRQCRQGWDCLAGRESGAASQLANIGVYMLKYQPYSDGPAFVRMAERLGGWDAVNDLYTDLPASSEQVIHPQRYGVDEPTDVALNDSATDAWERIRPPDRPDYAEVGEAGLMAMFVFPYYDSGGQTEVVAPAQWFNQNETGNVSDFDPLNYESAYSTGWDGDRLHAYENESGEQAYVWRLAWDSPQDAEQFVEGYERVLRYWGGQQLGPNTWRIDDGGFADAFYVDVNATTVTVVNAPTVGQLSNVEADADPVAPGTSADDAASESDGTTTDDGDGTTTDDGDGTTTDDGDASATDDADGTDGDAAAEATMVTETTTEDDGGAKADATEDGEDDETETTTAE